MYLAAFSTRLADDLTREETQIANVLRNPVLAVLPDEKSARGVQATFRLLREGKPARVFDLAQPEGSVCVGTVADDTAIVVFFARISGSRLSCVGSRCWTTIKAMPVARRAPGCTRQRMSTALMFPSGLADQKETRRLPLLGIGVADADQAFSKTAARRFPRGFVTASDWNCPCTEIR
jgi:hypothetical protein